MMRRGRAGAIGGDGRDGRDGQDGQDGRRVEPTGEEGQTTVLMVGLCALCLLLATVILAATTVNLEARRLLSVADGATLAAADSFTIAVEEGSSDAQDGSAPVLDDASAAQAVAGYLAAAGAHERFEGLAVQSVTVGDGGRTVAVELTATARPPVVNWIVPEGVTVVATSSSRTALTR